ncbi:hypothetical protein BGX38DRAFT_1246750 [Terfezia claveryi]|nr:hypothetical protein BGX38DRAFT_1246750 [Terfezia claveryi]
MMGRKSTGKHRAIEEEPSTSESRKRPATQASREAPLMSNQLTFLDEDDNDETNSDSDTGDSTCVIAPGLGKNTRAFSSIPGHYQYMTSIARTAWHKAQGNRYVERIKPVDTYLKSIHTRTRAHLVAECRHTIIKVYGLNHLYKDDLKIEVEKLLDNDRFICRQATREELKNRFRAEEIVKVIFQKYFYSKRMKGNRDPGFLERINGVFICFVSTAMRHCLKMWKTGEYKDNGLEFKYETTWLSYNRLWLTWNGNKPEIQDLLVKNIKADLARRIAANVKIVELESGEPPEVEDQLSFEVNLRKELKHSYERLEVSENKRLRVGGLLRDSSVELADPLSPAVDNSILGEEEAETQDQENAAGQEDAEVEENAGSEDEL